MQIPCLRVTAERGRERERECWQGHFTALSFAAVRERWTLSETREILRVVLPFVSVEREITDIERLREERERDEQVRESRVQRYRETS